MPQLRVLIAVQNQSENNRLRTKLLKIGHLVIGQVHEAKEVLRVAFETQPDLVLLDPDLPDYSGLGVAQVIDEHRVAPIVFVSPEHAPITRQAGNGWLFSYLVSPYSDEDLYLAVDVAVANFRRLQTLEQENARLKRNLETRKLVERAKGYLAARTGMTEPQAYKYLQKLSMDTSRSLAAVAREVLKEMEARDGK